VIGLLIHTVHVLVNTVLFEYKNLGPQLQNTVELIAIKLVEVPAIPAYFIVHTAFFSK
jgi:hypothetical protein